jgi:hypothetical protein
MWDWPDFVPNEVRKQIEEFWSRNRTIDDWKKNAELNAMPELGQRVRMLSVGRETRVVEGRFVHAWNNIGRIITDDCMIEYVCNPFGKLLQFGETQRNWLVVEDCSTTNKAKNCI